MVWNGGLASRMQLGVLGLPGHSTERNQGMISFSHSQFLVQESAHFFCKGPGSKCAHFAGHMVSVTTVQLCRLGMGARGTREGRVAVFSEDLTDNTDRR